MIEFEQKDTKKILEMGADPNFILFLLAWNALINVEIIPLDIDRGSSYQRKIKRRAQRDFGPGWKDFYQGIKEGWKLQNRMVLIKTLFWLQPAKPNEVGSPRKENLWGFVRDCRNYFYRCSSHYHMEVIASILDLVLDKCWEYFYLNSEWSRRKKWFANEDGKKRLDVLLSFYEGRKEKILQSLKTGVPIYELNNHIT